MIIWFEFIGISHTNAIAVAYKINETDAIMNGVRRLSWPGQGDWKCKALIQK